MESFLSLFSVDDIFEDFNKLLIVLILITGLVTSFRFVSRNITHVTVTFFYYLLMVFWLKKQIYTKESSTCTPVLPEVPDPPKRNKRRSKKRSPNKSKYKAMDDSSETSSNSDQSTKSDPSFCKMSEKTKIYAPLLIWDQLNMDRYALYFEFERYVLSEHQLCINGFPKVSPDHPDRAVFHEQPNKKETTERQCCRCTSVFHVLPDGQYKAKDWCQYHLKKQVPFRYGHPYRGDFPCCNGNYLSKGCMTWQYHVTQESALEDVPFVKTREKKHLSKSKARNVYALDCEMVYTTAGMEVAKVGIVGVDGLTLYETFVLPQNPILDYNTQYSGITENDLKDVSVTLIDVQTYLLKILNKDSILVGHGLENDLKALRLIHNKIVDTSVVFPPYQQHKNVVSKRLMKRSLRNLAQEFLHQQIQQSRNGHNCIEDARTCMELMLLRIWEDMPQNRMSSSPVTFQSAIEMEVPRILPSKPTVKILPTQITIKGSREERNTFTLPVDDAQDENKNSILQNMNYNSHSDATYPPFEYTSCNSKYTDYSLYKDSSFFNNSHSYSYCGDSYKNSFYSGYLLASKSNHSGCIY